jgi:hypothetical protein
LAFLASWREQIPVFDSHGPAENFAQAAKTFNYCNAKFGALFFLARFVPLRESIRFWLRLSRAPGSVVVFREVLGERARYV